MVANKLKCLESLLLFLDFLNPDMNFAVMVLWILFFLDGHILVRTSLQSWYLLLFLYLFI